MQKAIDRKGSSGNGGQHSLNAEVTRMHACTHTLFLLD